MTQLIDDIKREARELRRHGGYLWGGLFSRERLNHFNGDAVDFLAYINRRIFKGKYKNDYIICKHPEKFKLLKTSLTLDSSKVSYQMEKVEHSKKIKKGASKVYEINVFGYESDVRRERKAFHKYVKNSRAKKRLLNSSDIFLYKSLRPAGYI